MRCRLTHQLQASSDALDLIGTDVENFMTSGLCYVATVRACICGSGRRSMITSTEVSGAIECRRFQ